MDENDEVFEIPKSSSKGGKPLTKKVMKCLTAPFSNYLQSYMMLFCSTEKKTPCETSMPSCDDDDDDDDDDVVIIASSSKSKGKKPLRKEVTIQLQQVKILAYDRV